jgi:hypothetical protein
VLAPGTDSSETRSAGGGPNSIAPAPEPETSMGRGTLSCIAMMQF